MRILPRWLPYAILAMAATFLALRWDTLPERWVSHWGPGGVPNGWSHRAPGDVFGPLLLALPVLILVEILQAIPLRRARQQPHLAPVSAATQQLLRLIASGLACFFGFLAISLPLRGSVNPPRMIGIVLAFLVAPVIIGIILIYRSTVRLRDSGALPKGYSGLVYRNSDDPRLWVPKLIGPGMTVNFAHPWAWPILLALLIGPFILAALIAGLVAHR